MSTAPFAEGDYVLSTYEGEFHVSKVLRIDEWPDGSFCYHICGYKPSKTQPTANDVEHLEVEYMHAPIGTFENATLLANKPVSEDELEGFYYYLKQTDFNRYLSETGQDPEEVIQNAQAAYKEAWYLGDGGNHEGAIEKYTDAIELFPMFYEALDNRAFSHMDLGRFEEAIWDFEASLQVNPNSVLALFSIGECHFKMGQFSEAIEQFNKVLAIEPEEQHAQHFLKLAEEKL